MFKQIGGKTTKTKINYYTENNFFRTFFSNQSTQKKNMTTHNRDSLKRVVRGNKNHLL